MKSRDFFSINLPDFSHLEILNSPIDFFYVVNQGNHHIAAVTSTTFQQPACCCTFFFWTNDFEKGLANGHNTITQPKGTNPWVIVVRREPKNVKNLLAYRGQLTSNQCYLL